MRPDIPAYQVTEKMTEMQGAQAVGAWQHWMSTLYGLESDVYGDQHFSARLGTFELGPVGMTRIEASRHRVRRTSASMARRSTDFLKIVAPWHGEARVCQNGREAVARSGQWLIYDTTQEYEVLNPEWCEHLIITLPKSRFEDHGRAIDALMGRYVGGGEGVSRIALDMMRGTFAECRAMGQGLAQHVTDSLLQLIQLSLLDACGRAASLSASELLLGRIKAYVRQHLRDPALSVDAVAAALNCSKRHLYNAFADERLSISQHIWAERVALFQRELLSPTNRHCTLTELALASGFASGAHLSRLFKQHTGQTPAQFRAGMFGSKLLN
ncbi:AraC family transcriptional regulator [Comamonas testosteroni]|uniref:AraC family transcriptional regulator n=1 Tax=Comamonas testosteroni TaxID=285 RepID=UPI0028EF300C|nr:AraC family transcriptional regulator [Comamonas testosteroni]